MKTLKMIIKTKRNLTAIMLTSGITLGMFTLLMACNNTNDESSTTQDSIANVKSVEIQKVDSTAVQDTAKKVDVSVKKP